VIAIGSSFGKRNGSFFSVADGVRGLVVVNMGEGYPPMETKGCIGIGIGVCIGVDLGIDIVVDMVIGAGIDIDTGRVIGKSLGIGIGIGIDLGMGMGGCCICF
jgi:hypothetical protein